MIEEINYDEDFSIDISSIKLPDNFLSLLTNNFKFPNYNNELSKAEDLINKQKKYVTAIVNDETITTTSHEYHYNEVIKLLDFVGSLSKHLFDIQADIENYYTMTYLHSPKLGKLLYNTHLEILHKKYDLLKDRCHTLLNKLDYAFIDKYDKNPPNWNI